MAQCQPASQHHMDRYSCIIMIKHTHSTRLYTFFLIFLNIISFSSFAGMCTTALPMRQLSTHLFQFFIKNCYEAKRTFLCCTCEMWMSDRGKPTRRHQQLRMHHHHRRWLWPRPSLPSNWPFYRVSFVWPTTRRATTLISLILCCSVLSHTFNGK